MSSDKPALKSTLHSWQTLDAEAPEILLHDITFGAELARGNFGTVFKGRCRGETVAIKELNDLDEEAFEEFRSEVAIMSHLRHPNIVLLMGAVTRGDLLCIVTEYCEGGDLDRLLSDKKLEFSLPQKIKLLLDVCSGMNWLHCSSPPIIHRDLKPGNILLSADFKNAKVGDMGLSTIQYRRKIKSYGAGSYLWMAPESLMEQPHTEKVDVYSFAIVAWQVLDWNPDPFKKYLEMVDLQKLIDAVAKRHERPHLPTWVHPSLVRVIERSWHPSSQDRPSFGQLIEVLADCGISSIIQDDLAAGFWKLNWRRVENKRKIETAKFVVPFPEFAPRFYDYIRREFPKEPEHDHEYLSLRALVSQRISATSYIVKMEQFNRLFQWFGPLSKGGKLLEELLAIVSEPWFHGEIDKAEAQSLLSNVRKTEGKNSALTYLLRLNTSEPIAKQPFTISKINKAGNIVHQRVYYSKGTKEHYITIKTAEGESDQISSEDGIVSLMDKIQKDTQMLGSIAPRTRFNDIFHSRVENDLGYLDEQ